MATDGEIGIASSDEWRTRLVAARCYIHEGDVKHVCANTYGRHSFRQRMGLMGIGRVKPCVRLPFGMVPRSVPRPRQTTAEDPEHLTVTKAVGGQR